MIHETFLCLTETAFGSHPCRVVSITYCEAVLFPRRKRGLESSGDTNPITKLQFIL